VWCVEIMAQAVGAVYNLSRRYDNSLEPNFGYLIKIDSCEIDTDDPPHLGDLLEARVSLIEELQPVGCFAVELCVGRRLLAKATMKFLVER